ncbi:MAG: hypothetical protein ACM3TR_09935 [Caulobacteraceae bacterium]
MSIDGKSISADNLFAALVSHLGIQGAHSIAVLYNHLWDGDEVTGEDMSCRNCPWFNDCAAMDEPYKK